MLNETACYAGEFLLAEANGTMSREQITISSAAGALAAGTVLGKITTGGAITVGTVTFAGTGDGTCTKADPAYGSGVLAGSYTAVCLEKTADLGTFQVIRPDGTIDGIATVGVAYDGQVKFTIADGATDFAAGDTFTIPVTAAANAAAGEWVAYDADATDGSQVAAGILYGAVADSASDQAAVAIVRHAEVVESMLTGLDAAAKVRLAAIGIICRA